MANDGKLTVGHMSNNNMYYYSSTMPQGSEEAKNLVNLWNEADHDLFTKAMHTSGTNEHTLAAQKRLVELGLLEPHLVDGLRGPKTDGAIRRYNANTSKSGHQYDLSKAMKDAGDWIYVKIWGE